LLSLTTGRAGRIGAAWLTQMIRYLFY